MTTDDERPSGTGLRGALAKALHFPTDRGNMFGGYDCACGSPWLTDRCADDIEDKWEQFDAVLALLADHPDAAAGTTVEEWGFQWPEGVYHEGDGIYAYPNPGTEETSAARKTHRAMGATIYRRTRTTYADTVTEWEEVDGNL